MNDLTTEKAMTVREVAEVLGMSYDTIMAKARELGFSQNGKTTFLNEKQVFEIKQLLVPRTFEMKSKVESALTETDIARMTLQVIEYHRAKVVQLEVENAEMKPKAEFYDAVTGSADTIDMKEAAKILNIPGIGRNNLFEILRNKGILDRHNQPYQTFVDRGYFRIIESSYSLPTGETKISLKTVVFQKGLNFIRQSVSASA